MQKPHGAPAGVVLVAGGTGFIGSAVVRALLAVPAPPRVRVLSRGALPDWMAAAGVEHARADLADPHTLRGRCDGVTTLLHLASYVGRDTHRCKAVNESGTRALLAEAARAGTARTVYVSTASVYGSGPHRGPAEAELRPSPASPTSASRWRAEQLVREARGTVLRPNLVYGAGDRWYLPTLARLVRAVPHWPEGGGARASLVAVDDLARVVVALALDGPPYDHGGRDTVYHVGDPRPVSLRAQVRALCAVGGVPLPHGSLSHAEHRARAERSLPDLTAHQHALLTQDAWYDSGRVWRELGLDPGPGFAARFGAAAAWYRQHLGEEAHGAA